MTQIKLRRDTSSAFALSNPILGNGEPAYETDTKKLKIGDGTTAYTSLAYFAGGGGSAEFNVVQPLKLVDGTLTLQIDEQTIQVQNGKLVANLDELGNEVNTLSGDVAGVQADLLNKQDKFTPVVPLAINSTTITTTVPTSVTETAESYTGGAATGSQVVVDISALNIDANSNWKLHLSGHLGNWQNSTVNTAAFYIETTDTRIFNFWHGNNYFRLGFGSDVFNRVPNPATDFYYEVIHQKDATQFTFAGTNLVSSDPLLISEMSQKMNQTPYETLAGKGKLKSFGFPIFSKTFQRIDKDINKSYFEADGVKYPITSVQGINTLRLGIGDGLSVVDNKLTTTGGGITIDDVSPDYTAGVDVSGYSTSANQFTAPSAGIIYFFGALGGGTGNRPEIYINNVRISDLYAVGSTSTFSVNNGEQFVLGKGDKYYATYCETKWCPAANKFYPLKGVNKQ